MSPELATRRVDGTERGLVGKRGMRERGPLKKECYWKSRQKRSSKEGPTEERVVGKGALIPCEEKNNSLIFID